MAITGRFGAPAAGDLLTVSFDSRYLVRLTDSETRRFRTGLQGQLKRAHDKISSRLQLAAAEKLDIGMENKLPHRPQREGERLKSAILDEANRSVTATGFSVGFASWMNRSPAKLYWRGIEEGIGDYWTGALFTTNFRSFFHPGIEGIRRDTSMRMLQVHSRINAEGEEVEAKPVHVSAFFGYEYFKGMPKAFGRMDIASYYRAEGVPIEQFKGVGKK